MKTWYHALYLSVAALLLLVTVLVLPGGYSIFVWSTTGTTGGKLLPVMFVIWILSLVAFALNNGFEDKCYISQDIKMNPLIKYLPSLFGTPVLLSFIRVVYRIVKEIPMV